MSSKKARKYAITFHQPSLTQQHQKDEADINKIMAKYMKTGVIDHVAKYEPHYEDHTGHDYHDSMNIVANANSMFEELPAQARKQFKNDPARFLDFVSNPENASQFEAMGLTEPQANTITLSSENPPLGSPAEPEQTQKEPAPAAETPPNSTT